MKKWMFIIGAVVIVIIWQTVSVYQTALAGKDNGNAAAQKKAEDRYPVNHVNGVTFYHGQKDYHVVDAVLKNGRHVYIWVPDSKKGKYLMMAASDGYSKADILKAFESHVSYKKIISTRLGMEDGRPAWEITYIDKDGGYVFSYYDFETGESIIDPISIQ
ncbi:MAG: PepSY domain-containing protein [Tuberibacillus sp.]